jgi:hypothetical protein
VTAVDEKAATERHGAALYGGLTLIAGIGTILASMVLFRNWGYPALRRLTGLDGTFADTLGKLSAMAVLGLAYWAFVRLYEKRAVVELAFAPRAISLAAAAGSLLISAVCLHFRETCGWSEQTMPRGTSRSS